MAALDWSASLANTSPSTKARERKLNDDTQEMGMQWSSIKKGGYHSLIREPISSLKYFFVRLELVTATSRLLKKSALSYDWFTPTWAHFNLTGRTHTFKILMSKYLCFPLLFLLHFKSIRIGELWTK